MMAVCLSLRSWLTPLESDPDSLDWAASFYYSGLTPLLLTPFADSSLQSRAEQSISLLPAISRHDHSWHRAPMGPVAIYLLLVWQLRFFFFLWGALSDERTGLTFIYAAASAIFLWSEPLGSRDHILLSHIWDFQFCRLLRLAGSRWRYSIPPPHGGAPPCFQVCLLCLA
jgi:hypothetical protein